MYFPLFAALHILAALALTLVLVVVVTCLAYKLHNFLSYLMLAIVVGASVSILAGASSTNKCLDSRILACESVQKAIDNKGLEDAEYFTNYILPTALEMEALVENRYIDFCASLCGIPSCEEIRDTFYTECVGDWEYWKECAASLALGVIAKLS